MPVDPISLGLGGLSLIGGKNASKKRDKYNAKAGKVADWELALKKMLTGEAMSHNYGEDTATAVNYAGAQTQDTLTRALRNLNAEYRAGGGQPGADSEFNVRAQGMTNRVSDPLRAFAANMKANEFTRRMNAIIGAAGAGGPAGQIAQTYFNMANSYNPNIGGGLDMLSGAFDAWNPFGGNAPGGGYSNPDGSSGGGSMPRRR